LFGPISVLSQKFLTASAHLNTICRIELSVALFK
jgi:hypothetical protein